jgi:hypothetical protein
MKKYIWEKPKLKVLNKSRIEGGTPNLGTVEDLPYNPNGS